jgi:radical SAM superfamily enzyme YgiQ (UPF0313 family)
MQNSIPPGPLNVLLLYPEFPDTFWSFRHALRFLGARAAFPPLGLLTVAALLPEAWPKRLVDLNVTTLRDRDLEWADCVLISGMTVQRESARRLIARCRAAGLPVVAGGPLFTTEPENFPEVDHFVLNEAELTLPRFLADLERGVPERFYRSEEFADIRLSPTPLWELADLRRYSSLSLQYSRGCPFQCDFCNVTALFGHRPRTKTPAQVLAELELLRRLGWKGKVFFVDDNLIGNKHRLATELLPELIAWQRAGGRMPFFTEASINLADDEPLMAQMREAGFESVFVGIETPDAESLEECHKKQNTRRDLIADVKRIQRAGLEVQAGFIVGFDNDTETIFQRQIDFIQKSGIVVAMVGLLQAVQGTRLHERLFREGRLRGDTSGDNVDGSTNIVTRMDRDVLLGGYRRILRTIYAPAGYYARLRTFLREYRAPKISQRFQLQHLRAFLYSIFALGVVGRERVHFWKLLGWTVWARPEHLSRAVALAICGYHFRIVCGADEPDAGETPPPAGG